MQNVLNTAVSLIDKLNQVQAAVGGAGMATESALLLEVKDDLATLVAAVPPQDLVVRRFLDAGFRDVMSSMDHFLATISEVTRFDRHSWRDSAEFETILHNSALSAEVFAMRSHEFLNVKRSADITVGGDTHGN